jgi:Zn-dependent protease/predicted transcriptional regulator
VSSAIRLGRFSGAEVVADVSVSLLVLFFSGAVFIHLRQTVAVAPNEGAGILAVLAGVAVVGCVFVHEAAHVLLAQRKELSVRSIRLFMFGGYSVIDGDPSMRTELLVAGAGPLASLLLGFVIVAISYASGSSTLVGATLFAVGIASVAIGTFNLLPGFPLDGGRMIRSILVLGGRDRVQATRDVTVIGRVLGVTAMGIGVYLLVTRQTVGLFWLLGGWLLMVAAVSTGKREVLSVALDGLTVADLMSPTPEAVSGDATISDVLDEHSIGSRMSAMPVQVSDRVVGVIGEEEIDSVAPSRWPSMRARALMSKIGPADVVDAEDPLEILFVGATRSGGRIVVVRDGVVVGIVEEHDLASMQGAEPSAKIPAVTG